MNDRLRCNTRAGIRAFLHFRDFSCSLTPDQLRAFTSSGGLPVTQLSRDQQEELYGFEVMRYLSDAPICESPEKRFRLRDRDAECCRLFEQMCVGYSLPTLERVGNSPGLPYSITGSKKWVVTGKYSSESRILAICISNRDDQGKFHPLDTMSGNMPKGFSLDTPQ